MPSKRVKHHTHNSNCNCNLHTKECAAFLAMKSKVTRSTVTAVAVQRGHVYNVATTGVGQRPSAVILN